MEFSFNYKLNVKKSYKADQSIHIRQEKVHLKLTGRTNKYIFLTGEP